MKKCPKCKEEIKEEAEKCKHCKTSLTENTKKNDPLRACGYGCLPILLFVIFISIASFFTSDNQNNTTTNTSVGPTCENAYITSVVYVEKELKAPSTAEFPYNYSESCIKYSDDQFQINSYVDSENSYGTKVRTSWTVTVRYTGGDPSSMLAWRLERISVGS
jgi:hypothetical protein